MSQPRIVMSPAVLRAELAGNAPGLVPTMGALHDGHLALIQRSAAENEVTVVSVFVNPTQFNNPNDLAAYPRPLERDAAAATHAGATVIYAPIVESVYPPGFSTSVEVGDITTRWEGEHRPGHFRGVATVVTILLNTVRPARAYFGEKDYQQLQLIKRMARDLWLPGEIVGCPTVRDHDGLALSSRNARLSPADRAAAAAVPRALFHMAELARSGAADVDRLVAAGREILDNAGLAIDYLAVVHPATLAPLRSLVPGARALVAVHAGDVRLIDNLELLPATLDPLLLP